MTWFARRWRSSGSEAATPEPGPPRRRGGAEADSGAAAGCRPRYITGGGSSLGRQDGARTRNSDHPGSNPPARSDLIAHPDPPRSRPAPGRRPAAGWRRLGRVAAGRAGRRPRRASLIGGPASGLVRLQARPADPARSLLRTRRTARAVTRRDREPQLGQPFARPGDQPSSFSWRWSSGSSAGRSLARTITVPAGAGGYRSTGKSRGSRRRYA
jgi:hypothetical protein